VSTLAILLVLAAAVAHASWNVIAHGASRSGLPFLWAGSVASTVLWLPVVPLTGGIGAGEFQGFAIGDGSSPSTVMATITVSSGPVPRAVA